MMRTTSPTEQRLSWSSAMNLAALEEHLGRSLQEPQPLELMAGDRSAAPEEVES